MPTDRPPRKPHQFQIDRWKLENPWCVLKDGTECVLMRFPDELQATVGSAEFGGLPRVDHEQKKVFVR